MLPHPVVYGVNGSARGSLWPCVRYAKPSFQNNEKQKQANRNISVSPAPGSCNQKP